MAGASVAAILLVLVLAVSSPAPWLGVRASAGLDVGAAVGAPDTEPREPEPREPWFPAGGARYVSSHSLPGPVPGAAHFDSFGDAEVREHHFHVYFLQRNAASVSDALRLQRLLVDAVAAGKFVCVLHGVTGAMPALTGLNESAIPPINHEPIGPHPVGSFEVWTPFESMAAVLSFVMLHRGETTVLLHPLTRHCVEDHSGRAMWLGPPFRIDLTVLEHDDPECDRPQYPELGLGYSAKVGFPHEELLS